MTLSCRSAPLAAGARRALCLLMLGAAPLTQAQTTTWSTGQVDITFDASSFSFFKETGFGTVDISPQNIQYTLAGQGVTLDFADQLAVLASSYTNYTPQSLSGYFSALFDFTPRAGYAITDYTITATGTYSVETPGAVWAETPAGSLSHTTGAGTFTLNNYVGGSATPALQGSFGAMGDVSTVRIFEGYYTYIDRYEDVLDYCESEEPFTCYWRSEPVYVTEEIYRDETDLGEASLSLQTLTITAQVVAVPEPGALALLLAGLPGVFWWAGRGRSRRAT